MNEPLTAMEQAAWDVALHLEKLYGNDPEYGGPPCNAPLHRAMIKMGMTVPHSYGDHKEEEK